jgi:hypothetical protein
MLLYPHHDEMQCEEGLTSEHRITTTDHRLTTATIGLADLASVQARLSSLISDRLGPELTGIAERAVIAA